MFSLSFKALCYVTTIFDLSVDLLHLVLSNIGLGDKIEALCCPVTMATLFPPLQLAPLPHPPCTLLTGATLSACQ